MEKLIMDVVLGVGVALVFLVLGGGLLDFLGVFRRRQSTKDER